MQRFVIFFFFFFFVKQKAGSFINSLNSVLHALTDNGMQGTIELTGYLSDSAFLHS